MEEIIIIKVAPILMRFWNYIDELNGKTFKSIESIDERLNQHFGKNWRENTSYDIEYWTIPGFVNGLNEEYISDQCHFAYVYINKEAK